MATIIKIRRDGTIDWESNNPILAEGEIGYESNLNRLKIGNGLTGWNSLPYIIGTPVPVGAVFTDTVYSSSEIKSMYEQNSNTNAFTDIEKDKLAGISGVNTGDQDLSGLALKSNVIEKNNTEEFIPSTDYEPATKKYVDDSVGTGSSGDMLKSEYDSTGTGNKVDTAINAEKVNGLTVMTSVPAGAVFTDTTYLIGNGGLTQVNFTSVKDSKLAGIDDDANNYTHPSGDGNLHVPANGTNNSGKVLTASGTAGLYTWETPVTGITDHALLSNIGSNSHAQIDAHIANSNNPHGVTSNDVGLGSVDNTSDVDKPVSTQQAQAIGLKENSLGSPDTDGKALVSTTDGVRSWVEIPTQGAVSFLELSDSPSEYIAGKLVKVNATGDGLVLGDPSGVTVGWGDINGNIVDQTDLSVALGEKIPATHPSNSVTSDHITLLGNTSGSNTGDQDLSGLAEKTNVLELDNTGEFTPASDYHPSTKKYVDDNTVSEFDLMTDVDTTGRLDGQVAYFDSTSDKIKFKDVVSGSGESSTGEIYTDSFPIPDSVGYDVVTPDQDIRHISMSPSGTMYGITDTTKKLYSVDMSTGVCTEAGDTWHYHPASMVFDGNGVLYYAAGSYIVRQSDNTQPFPVSEGIVSHPTITSLMYDGDRDAIITLSRMLYNGEYQFIFKVYSASEYTLIDSYTVSDDILDISLSNANISAEIFKGDLVSADYNNDKILVHNQYGKLQSEVTLSNVVFSGSYDANITFDRSDDSFMYVFGRFGLDGVNGFRICKVNMSIGTKNTPIGNMSSDQYDTNNSGVVDNAEKVNGHTVEEDVPSGALFTDTLYDDTYVVKYLESGSFVAPQRTGISMAANAIDFTLNNNMYFSATAADITVGNITECMGQSGVITVTNSENITGFSSEFKWKNIPTDLTGTERFAYFIEGLSSIAIGRIS